MTTYVTKSPRVAEQCVANIHSLPVPLKSHREGGLMRILSVEVQNPPTGMVWKFEERVTNHVLSSLLDHGSK
ncbi:hypothetical protein TNCV_2155631 [Trichonephila clavipes]|nr:hypothetical protein TNCV_2155631 [Trichonephila clavipes]